ncbi:hypothetical protein BJY01DRAFT_24278 [Aspergillus pseudoustus]|uniref:Subtelomeric hrmA-associated cluster protein AFUB-079030/YDR124W-like helical bundle domain-containing protein n=1 Tax=Aspergillus pseudoustus TaxID=1810923 RepID=A0ABR4JIS1_9EURO
MVVNAPTSTKPGSAKRPLSSLQDGCAGWEAASPMSAPRPSVNLPFAHYALIYLDNMGKLKVAESPSIQEQSRSVFTPEVRETFLEILGSKIGYHKPMLRRASAAPYAYSHTHDMSYHRHSKRRKASAHDPALEMSFSERFPEPAKPVVSPPTTNMVAVQIGDTEKVLEYYETALRHFQQINCRLIAKHFIKHIEPRKQVKHPYNGGESQNPEVTKPDWWPAGVMHKEPDHLKKEQRLRLLIHILRKLGKFDITAEKLEDIAQDCKRSLKPEETIDEKMDILTEIFKVRKQEERFERGEIDADSVVYVRNRDTPSKNAKPAESVIDDTEQKLELEEFEDAEEDPLAPGSSSEHLSASFSSVDPLARSFSMASDRGRTLSLNDSFSYGETPRHDRSYFTSAAEYTDDYPVLRGATTSGMVSPNEHPAAYDYLSHAPFSASTTGEHHRPLTMPMHHVSHYDTWGSPFRHSMYNSMEYGAPQTLSQNPMHYPVPMTPSNPHDIPHGLPEFGRERGLEFMGSRVSVAKPF